MSFFHKKNVTKFMGHHYAIWASDSNILLAQIFFLRAFGWPSFQTLIILKFFVLSVALGSTGIILPVVRE